MLRIFRYFKKKEVGFVFISLIFIVAQVWLDLKLPDYLKEMTQLLQVEGSGINEILTQGGYMMLCALGSTVSAIIVSYFASQVAAGLSKTLRGKVYSKTMSFSMGEINKFSTASLINRTTNDITQVQFLIAMGLQAIIKAPILAVWAVIKISGKSWEWTLSTVIAVCVLLLLMSLVIFVAIPRFRKIQKFTDSINRVTREQLTGIRVVRAYNAENYQKNKFAQVNDDLTDNNLVAGRVMAVMMPGITLINMGLTLAVYWIGAYLIDAASMMDKFNIFGDMIVFSTYAMQVIMAFMLLVMIFILLPRAQVSANRIMEVLSTDLTVLDKEETKQLTEQGTIEFKDVYFKYPDAGDYVLKGVSFTAKRGETVAFIGATGSGKSTLINLIPRFYDATKGQVLVDGVNVKDVRQEDLHNRIGYVPQKTVMFAGTVASNVAYGENGISEITIDEVKEAVRIAQGQDFVENMTNTYEGEISQAGTNVSGGQKQRISIARAIARKPEIFVFDDSFSALDYKTDRVLRAELQKSISDSTKIIVAQRIGTIRNADKIIVLEHGKIVGMGTHKELIENCKEYQEIANSQLSKEEIANG